MLHSYILKKLIEGVQEQLDSEIFLIHSAQFQPFSHSRKMLEIFSSPGRTQGPGEGTGATLKTVNVGLWTLRHFQPSPYLLPDYFTQRLENCAPGNWTSQDGRSRYQHQEISKKMVQPDHSTMKPMHGKSHPFTHEFQSAFQPPFLNISR